MARWKLTEPHYLNVPGTKWEMTMTDRATGRPKRMTYPVPLYLHPDADSDWNYQENRGLDGEIIVCHEGKGLPKDIVFEGSPTPGMLPLDEEAKEITAQFADKWVPTEASDSSSMNKPDTYSERLLKGLLEQMADTKTVASNMPAAPGFEKMMETMLAMMAQQTQILAAIAGKAAGVEFAQASTTPGEPAEAEIAASELVASTRDIASKAKATNHALERRL